MRCEREADQSSDVEGYCLPRRCDATIFIFCSDSLVVYLPLAVEKSLPYDSESVSSNHVVVISIRAASEGVSLMFRRCEETASMEKSLPRRPRHVPCLLQQRTSAALNSLVPS